MGRSDDALGPLMQAIERIEGALELVDDTAHRRSGAHVCNLIDVHIGRIAVQQRHCDEVLAWPEPFIKSPSTGRCPTRGKINRVFSCCVTPIGYECAWRLSDTAA